MWGFVCLNEINESLLLAEISGLVQSTEGLLLLHSEVMLKFMDVGLIFKKTFKVSGSNYLEAFFAAKNNFLTEVSLGRFPTLDGVHLLAEVNRY